MRKLSKILVLVLALVMMFVMTSMFTASAAEEGTVIYFQPTTSSDSWDAYCKAYAVYYWNDTGDAWIRMTEIDENTSLHTATIPAGYTNIIFVGLNSATGANSWDNKNSQTVNLTIPTDGKNLFTLEVSWNGDYEWKGTGSWSKLDCAHTPVGEGTVITPATCTTDGEISYVCSKCTQTYTQTLLSTGHSYEGKDAKCSCGAQATLTVVGGIGASDPSVFGVFWDPTSVANQMTYNADSGLWVSKVYVNDTDQEVWPNFKVAQDNSWNGAWGGSAMGLTDTDNAYIAVPAGATLTITFDYETKTLAAVVHEHSWSDANCTAPKTCSGCGATEGEALGHKWVDATYDAPKTCSGCGATEGEALVAVAQVGDVKYGDLQEAIKAAAPAGTVELLSDVTVDTWIMIAEKLTIGDGSLITLNVNGMTIDGNGYTLTVNAIESASNGTRLFYDAENLNVQDLTIKLADGLAGIGLQSGNITNVTFEGGVYGVLPSTGAITIEGCTFKTNGTAIYYEEARDNLVVNNNTFELADTANVILLRGATQFTNNTVVSGRTVNVVSGSPVVSGNNLGDVRFKVYNEATATVKNNTINNLVFNDDTTTYTVFEGNTLSESAQAALEAVLPAVDDGNHSFDATTDVTVGADKDVIAEGTTFDDGFFKVVGSVTQRVKDGAVYAIEVAKNATGAIEFTLRQKSVVSVVFSSTGGSNTSLVGIIDEEGNLVANNEGITEVTGASSGMTTVTYTLEAGTYRVVSPVETTTAYNRSARVFTINVAPAPAHEHTWVDATCTAPKTCSGCGATDGEALPHNYFYNLCLACYAPNPYFENNYTTVGENKLVCNQYHLVDDTGKHGKPYQFTFVTIPEDGFYTFTADATKLGVFIYTIPYDASDVDGWAVGGPNWDAVTFLQAELKAGEYYLGFIFYEGEGEYDLTITKHEEHSFAEGVCTVCGAADPNYVPPHEHNFVEGKCECGEVDPNYAPEQPPVEEPAEELNFFQKIMAWFMDLIKKLLAIFKK